MSEDYYQRTPIATWNDARGVWERPGTASLLCEHWEPYSETWIPSGWMRDGSVFELPMRELLTTGSVSSSSPIPEESLLRSPKASEGQGGALGEAEALRRGNTVGVRDQVLDLLAEQGQKVSRAERNELLPTPNTMDSLAPRDGEARERQLHRGGSDSRRSSTGNLREDILDLLPTPIVRDYKDGSSAVTRDERGGVQADTVARAIFNSGEVLLPTVTTSEATGAGKHGDGGDNLRTVAQDVISWGRFEPAIRRWENVLGRPAPEPTKPDGKDGAHRLSSRFTEWMMGLPDGWVTDVGLTRTEELKACGNGVVPQQAEYALRLLLGGGTVTFERPEGNVLPTPMVSDTFTGKLKSTQQKEGSLHSVTLPQAIAMITPPQQDTER
jgi:hypothetical protein